MDKAAEATVVSLFVEPDRRERTCFELSKPAKREACIWRLESRLMKGCAESITEGVPDAQTVLVILRRAGVKGKCYVLSVDPSVDGQWVRLEEAVSTTVFYGPALLWFPDCGLAYFEGEGDVGAPSRWILRAGKK